MVRSRPNSTELRRSSSCNWFCAAAIASLAVVRIGEYKAVLGPADVVWTGRRSVSEVLPRGAIVPFLVQSLGEEGGEKRARVLVEQEPRVEGSLLALEPKTGAVRAMVGGFDFERSKFNRATQAYRQVGSAFKPIIYAAAIERAGYTPATIIVDAPISFPDNNTVWTPHNYDFTFWGPIPLRRVDVNRAARRITDIMRSVLPREVRMECVLNEGPLFVQADRSRLTQVVSNLLDNAIKFTAARRGVEPCDRGDTSHRGCIQVALARDESAGMARLRVSTERMSSGCRSPCGRSRRPK